jgi:hypothetical protein
MVRFSLLPPYLLERNLRCPLNRRLGEIQSLSRRYEKEKNCTLAGTRTQEG